MSQLVEAVKNDAETRRAAARAALVELAGRREKPLKGDAEKLREAAETLGLAAGRLDEALALSVEITRLEANAANLEDSVMADAARRSELRIIDTKEATEVERAHAEARAARTAVSKKYALDAGRLALAQSANREISARRQQLGVLLGEKGGAR